MVSRRKMLLKLNNNHLLQLKLEIQFLWKTLQTLQWFYRIYFIKSLMFIILIRTQVIILISIVRSAFQDN